MYLYLKYFYLKYFVLILKYTCRVLMAHHWTNMVAGRTRTVPL